MLLTHSLFQVEGLSPSVRPIRCRDALETVVYRRRIPSLQTKEHTVRETTGFARAVALRLHRVGWSLRVHPSADVNLCGFFGHDDRDLVHNSVRQIQSTTSYTLERSKKIKIEEKKNN